VLALIGTQGTLAVNTANTFSKVLYKLLAIDLSLDEAVCIARSAVANNERAADRGYFGWSRFMVYLPTTKAVLLPRPKSQEIREHKAQARHEYQQSAINVAGNYIAGDQVGDDKTSVGNIVNANGVAIGRDAEAHVTCLDREQPDTVN
jgi:hypothetical protein